MALHVLGRPLGRQFPAGCPSRPVRYARPCGRPSDRERTLFGIGFVGLLYEAHRGAMDPETGVVDAVRRRNAAGPILEKLYRWVADERSKVIDEAPIAKAMNYLVNQRIPLARFLDDGHLRLDNNVSELELRRQVVGR